MKKIIFLMLFVLIGWQQAVAQSFSEGGIMYVAGSSETVGIVGTNMDLTGDLTIPAQVTYNDRIFTVDVIGQFAFQNASNLTSVTIPYTVSTIGQYAFSNCTSLKSVICLNTTPIVLGIYAGVFEGVDIGNCSLLVPAASVGAYGTADIWKDFSSVTCNPTINTTTISACGTYTWANNGQTYTATGVYMGTTANCVIEKLDLVITTPPAPTAESNQLYEGAASLVDLLVTGNAIKWYDAATGGTALRKFTPLVDGTTYYVSQTVDGCESARTAVIATLAVYTTIPDANFEHALVGLGIDSVDDDHRVLTSAIRGVTFMRVDSKGISDLTGIKDFTSLTYLDCSNNWLTSLDVSGMPKLATVLCPANRLLTSVNFSGLSSINEIWCNSSNLSSLDLSGLITLRNLFCGFNQLTNLNLTGCRAISTLNCGYNQLTSLPLSELRDLNTLYCENNALTKLDLSKCPLAYSMYCYDNPSLSCITVANVTAAYNNSSWRKDGSVSYSTNCDIPSALSFCTGAKVAAAVGSSTLKFYSALTGGSALAGTTTLTTKTYYATIMLNGVVSAPRVPVAITINALPAAVAIISSSVLNLGPYISTTDTVTYTATSGASSYIWTVPSNVTIVSGQGTNILTVDFSKVPSGAGTIGSLSVVAVNAAGCNSSAKTLTLTKTLPTAPSSIKMSDALLPIPASGIPTAVTSFAKYMGTNIVLTLTATPVANATLYEWELPTGVNQLSGGSSNVITVNFAGVTRANTYNYNAVNAVTGVVTPTNLLRIGVKAKNGVGVSVTANGTLVDPTTSSTARLLTLTAVLPTAVIGIVGQTTGLCGDRSYNYTITPSATASSYIITAPVGAIVQSNERGDETNILTTPYLNFTVTYPQGFITTTANPKTISIQSVNGVGIGLTSKIITLSTLMPSIGTVTGGATFTRCREQIISVPQIVGATNYLWKVADGAQIVSGQGTTTVLVSFTGVSATKSTNRLTVTASNSCGVASATKTITLASTTCIIDIKPGDVKGKKEKNDLTLNSVTALYPNPASNSFSIDVLASKAAVLNMTITSLTGAVVMRPRAVELTEGNNTFSENIATLPRGIYLVQLLNTANNELITKKLIKE